MTKKEYRLRYPERSKASDRQRYLRQREKRLERQRAYYQEHRDEILIKKKERINNILYGSTVK
jgi:hypothetical protein